MSNYIKLADLADQEFTVEAVTWSEWIKWDAQNNKMLKSNKYQQGYNKTYTIQTDKGKFNLSRKQMADCLEAVCVRGEASIIDKTFKVKVVTREDNGQEKRTYYINYVYRKEQEDVNF